MSFCGDHAKIRNGRLLRLPTRGVIVDVCVFACLSICLAVCLVVGDSGGATAGAESATGHDVLPSSLRNQELQPPKTHELCTQSGN